MNLQVKIQVSKDLEDSKVVVERLVGDNLNSKLEGYLNKYDKDDAEGTLELKADKNKKGLFDAVLSARLDRDDYRFEREDYKNLDDLINHLFDHLKEALSNK